PGRAAPAHGGDGRDGPLRVARAGHPGERGADEDGDADVDGHGGPGQAEDGDRAAVRGGEDAAALPLARPPRDGRGGAVPARPAGAVRTPKPCGLPGCMATAVKATSPSGSRTSLTTS